MKQIAIITALLCLALLIGTVGIQLTTGVPWIEAAYLAVITLMTVGSRDVPPPGNTAAMLFIIVYLLGGAGIMSYGAFQLGQLVVNSQLRGVWEQRRMQKSIAGLKDHYIICGLGRMGRAIAEQLQSRNRPFVIVDHDLARLKAVAGPSGWLYLHGDATQDDALRAAGIEHAAALATTLPSDADNVYVAMSAHLLAPKLNIVARASDESASNKLQRAGATRVISPIHTAGARMARFMVDPRVEEFLEISEGGLDLELVELAIGPDSPYSGQRLCDTDLQERGLNVIGLRRPDGTALLSPRQTTRMNSGDILFVFGSAPLVHRVVDQSNSGTEIPTVP